MKKITLIIKNNIDPSSYYRLLQYFDLTSDNVNVIEYCSTKTYQWYYNKRTKGSLFAKMIFAFVGIISIMKGMHRDEKGFHSDIVIVNREVFPRICPLFAQKRLEKYLSKRKVYWDFDDNIIQNNEITHAEMMLLSRLSSKIVVTNSYLKGTLEKEYMDKVLFLNTTDGCFESQNIKELEEHRELCYKKEVKLLWLGTKNNVIFLEKIIDDLDKCATRLKDQGKILKLYCVCNKELHSETNDLHVINVAWTREDSMALMKECHIGLMPLKCDEYTLGKAGFKAVQYLAAGIPAVVSSVGYNNEVIQHGKNGLLVEEDASWIDCVMRLSEDEVFWKECQANARTSWEEKFSYKRHKDFWYDLIEWR